MRPTPIFTTLSLRRSRYYVVMLGCTTWLLWLSGCVVQSRVTPFGSARPYAPTRPDQVTFLPLERDIPTDAERLGMIRLELHNLTSDEALQRAVRQRAAELGANAVYRINEGSRPTANDTFAVQYVALRLPDGVSARLAQ